MCWFARTKKQRCSSLCFILSPVVYSMCVEVEHRHQGQFLGDHALSFRTCMARRLCSSEIDNKPGLPSRNSIKGFVKPSLIQLNNIQRHQDDRAVQWMCCSSFPAGKPRDAGFTLSCVSCPWRVIVTELCVDVLRVPFAVRRLPVMAVGCKHDTASMSSFGGPNVRHQHEWAWHEARPRMSLSGVGP